MYERLVQMSGHVKVWRAYAEFEAAPIPMSQALREEEGGEEEEEEEMEMEKGKRKDGGRVEHGGDEGRRPAAPLPHLEFSLKRRRS